MKWLRSINHLLFQNGALVRSNRNWLYERVDRDANSGVELEALRSAEVQYMIARTPETTPFVQPISQPPDPVPASHLDPSKWLRPGGDVKVPVLLEHVEPKYPEAYRRLRIGGIVILEVEVSETGEVGLVRVLKSLAPDADMAGVEAVRRWKFEPATREEKPVPVVFSITINFKLK